MFLGCQTRPILNTIVTVYTHSAKLHCSDLTLLLCVLTRGSSTLLKIKRKKEANFFFMHLKYIGFVVAFNYFTRGGTKKKRKKKNHYNNNEMLTIRSVTGNDNALCVCATTKLLRENIPLPFRFDRICCSNQFRPEKTNYPEKM